LPITRPALSPHMCDHVNAFVDHPGGGCTCRRFGERQNSAVWCCSPGLAACGHGLKLATRSGSASRLRKRGWQGQKNKTDANASYRLQSGRQLWTCLPLASPLRHAWDQGMALQGLAIGWPQQSSKLAFRHGSTDQVALHLIASQQPQKLGLIFRFDTFRDDDQP
jgi:hypothetical protein